MSRPGNFDECLALMPDLLGLEKACPGSSCSFDGVYQPSTAGIEFVGLENFFHVSDFFDVAATPDQLDDIAREWCSKDLQILSEKFNKEPPEDASRRCFSAAYVHSVLTMGLKFHDTFPNIKFIREVDGTGIDWAIGSVLLESMQLQQTKPIPALPSPEPQSTSSFPFSNFWVFFLPIAVIMIAFTILRGSNRGRVRYTSIQNGRGVPIL